MNKTKVLLWVMFALVLFLTFDQAMRRDHDRLCSNDATAYEECRHDR